MKQRRVVLLGATGSIGRQACDVIAAHPDHFRLVGAVAGHDATALDAVMRRFGVERGAVVHAGGGHLPRGCAGGLDAACAVAAMDADVVCVAITGAAALQPALAAIDAGRVVALATKEVLVMAGDLVRARAAGTGARLVPVDSEHSAIWQCLRGEDPSTVSRIVLTASGGALLQRGLDELDAITPEQALAHPVWNMGPKITVDTSTMMNKGLEIIEAHHLFDMPYSGIDVVIHPTSRVHSFVEFVDGATKAQLGVPDMRVPISLALGEGERLPGVGPPLQLAGTTPMEFQAVDDRRFPAVRLVKESGERGGVCPAVLNAANEVAVERFLGGGCRFGEIVPLVARVVEEAPAVERPSLSDVLEADAWARARVSALLQSATSVS
jgi:1-deoxy-D-xylulose-5-phosphate reductoisomerase